MTLIKVSDQKDEYTVSYAVFASSDFKKVTDTITWPSSVLH
jgi:hypothetical protein